MLQEEQSSTTVPSERHKRGAQSLPEERGPWGGLRLPSARQVALVLAILAPFALLARVALHSTLTFDGGINYQVASNIAHGRGFARYYGGWSISPPEVQTSGFFLLIAALSVKAFGLSSLGLQLTNLLFIASLLTLTVLVLRPWPWLRFFGPLVLILAVPQVSNWALSGYGEFAVAALAVAALFFIARVAEGTERPYLSASAAFLACGVAITIKTVALATVPIVLMGLVLVVIVRAELSKWRLLASAFALPIPIVSWELYRLVQLGSWSRWIAYWKTGASDVGFQAGVAGGSPEPGLLHKGAHHIVLLANQMGISKVSLLIFLALPFLLVLLAFLLRGCAWREWLRKPGRALAVLLLSYSAIYLVWWVFVTPTSKAWLRRIEIAFVPLTLAYLLLLGFGLTALKQKYLPRLAARRSRILAAGLFVAILAAVAIVPIRSVVTENVRAYAHARSDQKNAEAVASKYVERLAADGGMLCGFEWWSAPVVSLTAHAGLCDLHRLDVCSPTIDSAFRTHGVFLIWDRYAMGIVSPKPTARNLQFTLVAHPSSYATIWRVNRAPNACG